MTIYKRLIANLYFYLKQTILKNKSKSLDCDLRVEQISFLWFA